VLVTDHSAFDYAAIAEISPLIIDTRNAFRNFRREHIIPL
jgi:UDP-N-acetyl-D-mannosaminuronate dehydrogenase